jgi:hypothetical protein
MSPQRLHPSPCVSRNQRQRRASAAPAADSSTSVACLLTPLTHAVARAAARALFADQQAATQPGATAHAPISAAASDV